ncbi:hypothetical protein VPH35_010220 [Triticum aestivum]|uniref:BAG family molecular chaperone regulator 7 isoform X2 n=1 Tax=Triticum aestivum TaxID=4565 RepID=UPI001D003F6D|nr:BAG family molecular chaperone regulator 7-like isoform X2 [Triticum aestivum]
MVLLHPMAAGWTRAMGILRRRGTHFLYSSLRGWGWGMKIKEDDKQKKKPARTCVQIEEIPEDNTAGCDAIRKAFAMGNGKGKAKELSPQDAALLIQMNYRPHLAHRSQVLRCLRDLAVAKAKLKELRSLFYNLSYRRRLSHDHEECQRFSEKIIVLLLTVDALEKYARKNKVSEPDSYLQDNKVLLHKSNGPTSRRRVS